MNISVIIITYNRRYELEYCFKSLIASIDSYNVHEIIIVDNNSDDSTKEYLKDIDCQFGFLRIFSLKQNRGVAGGRNFGVSKARGDLLLFLDDDAFFYSEHPMESVLHEFESDPSLGALAFNIKNYHTKTELGYEFPARNVRSLKGREFFTSYYIGAGHAIRATVFRRCGGYPEDYFYGKEELDMSFRIINEGYSIKYVPHVGIYHMQSLKGRLSNQEKWKMVYRNRLLVSYKYLPFFYLFVSSILWFVKTTILSKSVIVPVKSLLLYYRDRKKCEKVKLSRVALNYMKKNNGRLYF